MRERTREIRNDLTVVFHAFTTPAATALKNLMNQVVAELSNHSEAAALASSLLQGYAIPELDSAEQNLRRSLESHWSDHDRLREFMLERDLDKKKPDDYGFDTFIHYAHYTNLVFWARNAVDIFGRSLRDFSGFDEWSVLDDKLTDRLRQSFAAAELAIYRQELEDKFKR